MAKRATKNASEEPKAYLQKSRKYEYSKKAKAVIKRANEACLNQDSRAGIHQEIMLPEEMSEKYKTALNYTNVIATITEFDRFALYEEYVLELPDEIWITHEDWMVLVQDFIARNKFIENGYGVQIDIHTPCEGKEYWHAHLAIVKAVLN